MPKRRNRPRPPEERLGAGAGAGAVEPAVAPPVAPPTVSSGADLADLLVHPSRAQPVVVVTVAAGATEPYADVERLRSELAGLAEVHVLATGPQTWAFAHGLPPGTEVYGGAVRAYPASREWQHDLARAPLRFAYGPADRDRVTETVLSDAMSMAYAAGLLRQSVPTPSSRPAAGTVMGTVGGRALAQLEPRTPLPAMIWPELTAPDLPVESLFVRGMRVSGLYHPDQRRLDVVSMTREPREALADYRPGSVVLARVRYVERELCVAEVYPEVQAPVDVAALLEGEEGGDLRTLVSVGEVVRVVITGWEDDEPVLALAPDAADSLTAPSVLHGGPPWLVPPPPPLDAELDAAPTAPQPPVEGFAPAEVGDPQRAALQAERDQLLREVERAGQRAGAASRGLAASKTEVRRHRERAAALQRQLRDAEQRLGARTLVSPQPLFLDREQQLRFDVEVSWAYRTTPDEKADLPLARWSVGDHFFGSWDEVEGMGRDKVVDVVVEVLTGRAEQSGGRDLHQLRTGGGGGDPYVRRADGATCWRVALQQNTPSARRLHYWRLNDGSIELASIRLHDDTRP